MLFSNTLNIPRWHSGKESACQYRRHKRLGFEPWVGKIPRRREWQLTPVFLSIGNPMDRGAWWVTVHGVTESGMTEQPNNNNNADINFVKMIGSLGTEL